MGNVEWVASEIENLIVCCGKLGTSDATWPVCESALRRWSKELRAALAPRQAEAVEYRCSWCGRQRSANALAHDPHCMVRTHPHSDFARAELAAPALAGQREGDAEFRLLKRGDVIQRGDTILSDDTTRWLPLIGWEVGMHYDPGTLMPARRALAATPAGKGES